MEEKTVTTSTKVPNQPAAAAEVPTTEAAPAKPKVRKVIIDAFKSLSPAERMALHAELNEAIAHDADLHSQGLKADNTKYEAL